MSSAADDSKAILEIMHDLALATTRYHEAPPEQFEAARVQYEVALERFRVARGDETPRVMTAGSSQFSE